MLYIDSKCPAVYGNGTMYNSSILYFCKIINIITKLFIDFKGGKKHTHFQILHEIIMM